MNSEEKINSVLRRATEAIPHQFQQAPLTQIRRRSHRRRAAIAATAGLCVALILTGVAMLAGLPSGGGQQPDPAASSPAPRAAATPLPWLSILVNRYGDKLTVFTGPGRTCSTLRDPAIEVVSADSSQIVVSLTGRVLARSDCSQLGTANAVEVLLDQPLGDRTVIDAATGAPGQVYREADVPQPQASRGWSMLSASNHRWPDTEPFWVRSYNGPEGMSLNLKGTPSTWDPPAAEVLETIELGGHHCEIVANRNGIWYLYWEAGDARYSLGLQPSEGASISLEEFKQELTALDWPA